MDKQKRIEELGQDIYDNCPELCENGCGGMPCYKCIAEALQRDGYRKIPEGAVVLTREEYDGLKLIASNYGKAIKETEIKTAEKFAERLKAYIDSNKVQTAFFGRKCFIDKETVDEICKEITEGVK